MQDGSLVLTAQGLADYRAATAPQGTDARSDVQVQAQADAAYRELRAGDPDQRRRQYKAGAQTTRDYADTQYQGYADTVRSYADTQYQSLAPQATFTASAGVVTELTRNSVWTDGQLVAAINRSALQPASGVVGAGQPNVVGRDVTLNVSRTSARWRTACG